MSVASKRILKEIRALKHKKNRDGTKTYFAEGISIVISAVEHGAPVRYIIYSPELLRSEAAYNVISSVMGHITCYEAGPGFFSQISSRDNPVGIGAVLDYHEASTNELEPVERKVFVAADSIKNPGNLGSIIRTADCLGLAGVLISGKSTDQFHPECVKATMGGLYTVPITRFEAPEEVLIWCESRNVQVLTTSSKAKNDIADFSGYPRPLTVMLGSEGLGLEGSVLESGRFQVRIPMRGSVTSLNLAVAAGILMYDVVSKPSILT